MHLKQENIPQKAVLDYINSKVIPVLQDNYNDNASELSAQRRLLLAYDLISNGNLR